MIRRATGALLLLAAAGLWFAVGVPARRARDLARAEYARAREERERVRAQAVALERRGTAGRTPEAGAAAARALRASLLRATQGLRVGAVRIAVSAGQGRLAARGRLGAQGRMADVLSLVERLVGPASGVLVERVELGSSRAEEGSVLRLDLDAIGVRSSP